MKLEKDWVAKHLSAPATPPPPVPSKRRSRLWLWLLLALLFVSGGAATYLDRAGVLPVSEWLADLVPASEAPEAEATRTGNESKSPEQESERAKFTLFGSSDVQQAPEPAPEAPIDESFAEVSDPALASQAPGERTQSLERGIALMRREQAEALSKIETLQKNFVVRKRGQRRQPWSPAETIEEANLYLARGGLSTEQVFSAADARRNAQTVLNNSATRIKELQRKASSLSARIEKAETGTSP